MHSVKNPGPLDGVFGQLATSTDAGMSRGGSVERTANLLDLATSSSDPEERSRCVDQLMEELKNDGSNAGR